MFINSVSHFFFFLNMISADFMEVKPTVTRKLRRRPNDPMPIPEKRRKPSPDILFFFFLNSAVGGKSLLQF